MEVSRRYIGDSQSEPNPEGQLSWFEMLSDKPQRDGGRAFVATEGIRVDFQQKS